MGCGGFLLLECFFMQEDGCCVLLYESTPRQLDGIDLS